MSDSDRIAALEAQVRRLIAALTSLEQSHAIHRDPKYWSTER